MKKKYYFLKLAVLFALLYWLIESLIHYFWYGELEFKIIPSDIDELSMRISILILFVTFSLFADYQSKKSIEKTVIKNRADNIARAKKQWEVIVDSLPQLVIAMDHNARISRINRTVESWGVGKVNKVDGLYVSDFLKCLNKNYTDDAWTSDWPHIWEKIQNSNFISRVIDKENIAKTYQYTLRKIPDYDINKDKCFAVLIIDDITLRKNVEKSLKKQALALEKNVNKRTLELKQVNEQLEHKIEIQNITELALKESQQCRQNLLRDLFVAQETERKRIACELHDSIGQSLGATKFKVEELLMNKNNFIDDNEYSQFSNLVEIIKGSIDEVRHIAMDLRPSILDDLGTLATLKWFCREFGNTYTRIAVKLIFNATESDISEENKIVIFRIVQEAMNNIAKHAKATKIVLEFSKHDSGIRMFISDNGCGFDVNTLTTANISACKPGCSFGLNSMRERAESTSGNFEIKSNPGSGTSVIVSWQNQNKPL